MTQIILPAAADFHVHLRQEAMMQTVVPLIRQGGVNTVYVMPNLNPAITTVDAALQYKAQLLQIEPNVTYLMTLYLSESLSIEEIRKAKENGIVGIKSYPRGVTTNSEFGVSSYEQYYPILAEMERHNLILNLHGELAQSSSTTIFNAEESFLPILHDLHFRFPGLGIVFEHCSTKAAVEAILKCGERVVGTITPHHLYLTLDDWIEDPHSYCKPVAKLSRDRESLISIATSGNKKFFLGSDSAPHYKGFKDVKNGGMVAAGVFTQPLVLTYLAEIFEREGKLDMLEGFISTFGRDFYGLPSTQEKIILTREEGVIPDSYGEGECEVVPFRSGKKIHWKVTWM
ncbi:putative dihydroorotase [Neolecta irregularis DAH-3]|uniref:dihydroorotase n=1 Tax=Neolecta irregularis (strain DAH-3) TaxID=1198029 RepID=A0A1U7LVE2_NEOID|nr:putative dihydroorotase [Neolecta irregularis DAH-3]|eukprot:OLL26588.1 putative dihydroorotase [Neolecta irregularis DAH-3]